MASSCEAVQLKLAEHAGETEWLTDEERRHVEQCPQCSEAAAAEHALGRIFATVLPPADPNLEANVRAAMRSARRRRRVMAMLPVAASLLVALLGVVMLGGLPGGSLLALLPVWSSHGWVSLAASLSDWTTAVNTAAGAASVMLGPGVIVGAGIVSVLGLAAVAVTAARLRRVTPWQRDS